MNRQPPPLLSVVIPTHGRPRYLQRAVESALLSSVDGDVEVIVVPNGRDSTWKEVQERFGGESRVRWQPIPTAHANAARNAGLRLAKGRFLRFLDDDDTLDPAGAARQVRVASLENAEICSGTVAVVDDEAAVMRHMPHADRHDLFVAMTLHGRICLPVSHLFLREALDGFHWDETIPVEQDTAWMLGLASKREWRWVAIDDVVGQWTWHGGQRTSASITQARRAEITVNLLLQALDALCGRDALTGERKNALSQGLLHSAHTQFHFSPRKFGRAINLARRLSPGCQPPDPFFSFPLVRHIHPTIIEWLMMPKRWGNHLLRTR